MSATGSFGTPTIRGRGLRVEATFFAGAARSAVRSGLRSAVRSPPSLGVVVVVVVVVSSVIFYLPTRRRHDGDLHPAQPVDLVVLDLREHELLFEAEREVPAPVEAALRDALEVTDAWQRDGDELLVEVPHARSAQGDLEADGHADALAEVRDRLLRLRDDRLLAGDLRELTGG